MSANRPDITIVSDDDNLLSETQKRVVSVTKRRQASNTPAKPCPGYQLHFPPGQQAHTSYPFALHTILPLTWNFSGRRDGFFLTSHSCTGITGINGRCTPCDDLGNNEYLQKIVARFTDGIHENTPLVYHGAGGLIDIAHRKTQEIDLLRLRCLNDLKKSVGKEESIPNAAPEPSGSDVSFFDSEPTRMGSRQRCRDTGGLSLCLCGESVQSGDVGSIRCQSAGCETIWVSDLLVLQAPG